MERDADKMNAVLGTVRIKHLPPIKKRPIRYAVQQPSTQNNDNVERLYEADKQVEPDQVGKIDLTDEGRKSDPRMCGSSESKRKTDAVSTCCKRRRYSSSERSHPDDSRVGAGAVISHEGLTKEEHGMLFINLDSMDSLSGSGPQCADGCADDDLYHSDHSRSDDVLHIHTKNEHLPFEEIGSEVEELSQDNNTTSIGNISGRPPSCKNKVDGVETDESCVSEMIPHSVVTSHRRSQSKKRKKFPVRFAEQIAPYMCSTCGLTFSGRELFDQHNCNKSNKEDNSPNVSPRHDLAIAFTPTKPEVVSKPDEFEIVEVKETGKDKFTRERLPFTTACEFCSLRFDTYALLSNHIEAVHADRLPDATENTLNVEKVLESLDHANQTLRDIRAESLKSIPTAQFTFPAQKHTLENDEMPISNIHVRYKRAAIVNENPELNVLPKMSHKNDNCEYKDPLVFLEKSVKTTKPYFSSEQKLSGTVKRGRPPKQKYVPSINQTIPLQYLHNSSHGTVSSSQNTGHSLTNKNVITQRKGRPNVKGSLSVKLAMQKLKLNEDENRLDILFKDLPRQKYKNKISLVSSTNYGTTSEEVLPDIETEKHPATLENEEKDIDKQSEKSSVSTTSEAVSDQISDDVPVKIEKTDDVVSHNLLPDYDSRCDTHDKKTISPNVITCQKCDTGFTGRKAFCRHLLMRHQGKMPMSLKLDAIRSKIDPEKTERNNSETVVHQDSQFSVSNATLITTDLNGSLTGLASYRKNGDDKSEEVAVSEVLPESQVSLETPAQTEFATSVESTEPNAPTSSVKPVEVVSVNQESDELSEQLRSRGTLQESMHSFPKISSNQKSQKQNSPAQHKPVTETNTVAESKPDEVAAKGSVVDETGPPSDQLTSTANRDHNFDMNDLTISIVHKPSSQITKNSEEDPKQRTKHDRSTVKYQQNSLMRAKSKRNRTEIMSTERKDSLGEIHVEMCSDAERPSRRLQKSLDTNSSLGSTSRDSNLKTGSQVELQSASEVYSKDISPPDETDALDFHKDKMISVGGVKCYRDVRADETYDRILRSRSIRPQRTILPDFGTKKSTSNTYSCASCRLLFFTKRDLAIHFKMQHKSTLSTKLGVQMQKLKQDSDRWAEIWDDVDGAYTAAKEELESATRRAKEATTVQEKHEDAISGDDAEQYYRYEFHPVTETCADYENNGSYIHNLVPTIKVEKSDESDPPEYNQYSEKQDLPFDLGQHPIKLEKITDDELLSGSVVGEISVKSEFEKDMSYSTTDPWVDRNADEEVYSASFSRHCDVREESLIKSPNQSDFVSVTQSCRGKLVTDDDSGQSSPEREGRSADSDFEIAESSAEFPCPKCKQRFLYMDDCLVHYSVKHCSGKWICPACKAVFSALRGVSQHIVRLASRHDDTGSHARFYYRKSEFVACPICYSVFGDMFLFKGHLAIRSKRYGDEAHSAYYQNVFMKKHQSLFVEKDDVSVSPEAIELPSLAFKHATSKPKFKRDSDQTKNTSTKNSSETPTSEYESDRIFLSSDVGRPTSTSSTGISYTCTACQQITGSWQKLFNHLQLMASTGDARHKSVLNFQGRRKHISRKWEGKIQEQKEKMEEQERILKELIGKK